jgi:hypothetical protein
MIAREKVLRCGTQWNLPRDCASLAFNPPGLDLRRVKSYRYKYLRVYSEKSVREGGFLPGTVRILDCKNSLRLQGPSPDKSVNRKSATDGSFNWQNKTEAPHLGRFSNFSKIVSTVPQVTSPWLRMLMKLSRIVVTSVLVLVFLAGVGCAIYIHVSYSGTMPHESQSQTGRVHELTINHGEVVYVNDEELRLADFVLGKLFFVSMGCFAALLVTRIFWK